MSTSLEATGTDQGAHLSWSAAATPTDATYVVYCDDGSKPTARADLALDLSDECPSRTVLVARQEPSANVRPCAVAAANSTAAQVSSLSNGQPYAFAIATKTTDGEIGVLSALTCAIPSTSGEYELDGTTAGKNTSCSVSSVGAGSAMPLVLLAMLLLVLRRGFCATKNLPTACASRAVARRRCRTRS